MWFFKNKIKKSLENIDLEDVFIEDPSPNKQDEHLPERMPVLIKKSAISLPFILIAFLFGVIIIRVAYLQLRGSSYYETLAEKNRSQIEWITPRRGIIYDRNHKQIAYNIPTYNLVWNKKNVPKNDSEIKQALEKISSIVKISTDELQKTINESKENIVKLITDVSSEQVFTLKSLKENWSSSIEIEQHEKRDYPYPYSLSHILGYVGKVTDQEYQLKKDNYSVDDYIGKSGIELQYEDLLRGKIGIKNTEVSPLRNEIRPISEMEPKDGFNISLTIDSDLQNKIYETLTDTLKKNNLKAGAAVALDPRNGDILSLVSIPSFNNSELSQGMDQEKFTNLVESPNRQFFNRPISGTYPPGSTFKPIVAIGALEEKIISPEKGFNCEGFLRVANVYNQNISYVFRDWKTHGWTTLQKAIAQSCNVYFYMIGGGYENFKGLGIGKIKYYAKKFGLMEKTGIDLPGEISGFVPDSAWKKSVKNETWYIGDTYHASIGQGDVALTPLEVAQLYAFFANSGKTYKPRILSSVEETSGGIFNQIEPEVLINNIFNKKNIDYVRDGLREAVISGSAQILQGLPVTSAAKTGTAQFGDGTKSHAWFAAFAPYEDPEIVLVVLAEEGGGGSTTAAPVAYDILKWYFEQKLKVQN
jgi:penicillin-binding protein 2